MKFSVFLFSLAGTMFALWMFLTTSEVWQG